MHPCFLGVSDVMASAMEENTMSDEPASDEMSLLELQSRLRYLGYYDGPLEDRPWRATIMALNKFQRDRGLQVTSRPDTATAHALRDSICFESPVRWRDETMSAVLEGMLDTEIYPTDDALLAIKQANDIVVLLSVDQLLGVINELRAYYETRAQWQEATAG